MLAKMIDKIVSLKETKIFEIGGQTYTDGHLTRIPPHVDRPEAISVSGLDGVCKLIRTELEKVDTTIMVQAKSYKSVEVMTTYLPDFSRNILYRAEADAPGLRTGFRGREVALIELLNSMIPDDDPGVLVPHEVGDGGLLLMPTRAHIPDPQRDDWKPATCPICGAECWETEIHRQALAAEPGLRAVCTDCGLRGAAGVGLVDTSSKKEEKDHE